MILHSISSTPTSSRSVLEYIDDVLRSWTICSGVIGELSLAMPAENTVKDRKRAERRERIDVKDMMEWEGLGWWRVFRLVGGRPCGRVHDHFLT